MRVGLMSSCVIVIVALDVIEVDRLGDAVDLIEVAQVAVQVRVVDDPAQVAFEMPVVDRIEANQRHEEAPIGLERLGAEEIAPIAEPLFHRVERRRRAGRRRAS